MSRGVNKVILVGNLGKDPEIRYTNSGAAVANVTIATAEAWKDKQTGEKQERTEWHRVVFFARLAEIVSEYLKKGRQIYVEGRLQTRKWQDKDGNDRYTTEIVANEMQMLGGRDDANSEKFGASQPPAKDSDAAGSSAGAAAGAAAPSAASASKNTDAPAADFDDDIPF